ncbi:MAG: GAF domain-containing protein [Acidobacteriota bacterium]|jgi:signal transduction histidine kinase|nr:GAF domain-containing protein [Acidobacteriota bacterium]
MSQSANKESKENPRQNSSLSGYEHEPGEPRIIRLCRQYVTLAIGAAIIFLLHVSLNTWVYSSYLSTALGLLIVAGAVYFGLRIARQAHLDAGRNEKSLEAARQRTLEIAALYDTTQDISESRELALLLETILDRVTSLLAVSGGAIFLYDAERDDFQIAAETGVGMPIGTRLPMYEGLGGQVAETRAPLIVNDYQNWQNRSESLRELPICAAVCVPMIRNKELIGVLGAHEIIGAPKRRMFTDADARLLSLFADNAAGAVHNARLMEKLRRSEERFRIASGCASDLAYERDLVANTARFFGPKAGGPEVSHTMEEFHNSIHPQDRERVWTALQNHLKTGDPFSLEYRISDAKGGYITISDRAVAIRNQDGKPIRLIGSASDITERKRAEQLKSDFISFVTHQLRTPLSGVKWMLELAIDAKDNQEEMQSFIADARLSTERLIRLVNDLLDVSRLEQGRRKVAPQPVDLEKLTRDAAAEMSPSLLETKQTLTIEVANNLPCPNADRPLMRQAIMNLLSNSIKYTPAEGRIDIGISVEQGFVRWEIKDTGIGIPQDDREKLFEKFYRADNVLAVETEGTGLGLYLVRLTIERFGGRVWCESEEGAGSKFIFLLPAASNPEVPE